MNTLTLQDITSGSLVLNQQGQPIMIKHIDGIGVISGFSLIGVRWVCDIEEVKPIALTTIWLERLGFEHRKSNKWQLIDTADDGNYLVVLVDHIHSEDPPVFALTFQDSRLKKYVLEVSYVHHLQLLLWHLTHHWVSIPIIKSANK